MGSQWAHSTCLCTTKSPKVSLENHIFDPFLTDRWSQNSPFSRHYVTLEGRKWLAIGSKRAHSTCLCTPNGPRSNTFLAHFLTHFWSQNNPFSRHFVSLEGPKWVAMGSKRAHFTCLGTPNGLGSFLEKPIFDPFLTHFLSQNNPFSTHFGLLGGPKRATMSSKCAKNTCFGIPCGPRSILQKVFFFLHPVDLVDPFWHPAVWATTCSLPQPARPRYRGISVR